MSEGKNRNSWPWKWLVGIAIVMVIVIARFVPQIVIEFEPLPSSMGNAKDTTVWRKWEVPTNMKIVQESTTEKAPVKLIETVILHGKEKSMQALYFSPKQGKLVICFTESFVGYHIESIEKGKGLFLADIDLSSAKGRIKYSEGQEKPILLERIYMLPCTGEQSKDKWHNKPLVKNGCLYLWLPTRLRKGPEIPPDIRGVEV